MDLYQNHIEPRLVSMACASPAIRWERKKIVPAAKGVVLEVGFGSGHNLPFYNNGNVSKLFALEPSSHIRTLAKERVAASPLDIEFLDLPGEEIPLQDCSVDTILITFTMCTIPELAKALDGMRRVLKPSGTLLFAEHGLAPDMNVVKWQNKLNHVWGCMAGGCHLNRAIPQYIEQNGFKIEKVQSGYARKTPKFVGYMYTGSATVR